MSQYVKFNKYENYANNFIIGFKENIQRVLDSKRILIILDVTGSMGENINSYNEGTKIDFAKKIIKQIIEAYPKSYIDIMPFNEEAYPIISYDEIPEPDRCTYFSPLQPEVMKYVKPDSDYVTTIFISDGIPTEPEHIAHESIKKLGSMCRELGTNTISVAIGSDADGHACALFTGNRGYNCFVKYNDEIKPAMYDIINGIKCNYIQTSDKQWVPIEENGNYYYISDFINNYTEIEPTEEHIKKYISLIIQNEIQKPDVINTNKLVTFVKETAKILIDSTKRDGIIEFFTKSIKLIQHTINNYSGSASLTSATKQVYQTFSSQSVGI